MNPFDLDATGLLVWGVVAHAIADWIFQNDYMAVNKARRRARVRPGGFVFGPWWDRHPAAWVHAGIHGVALAFVFGWAAVPLALVHLVIDCRWVVAKVSRLMGQTQPEATDHGTVQIPRPPRQVDPRYITHPAQVPHSQPPDRHSVALPSGLIDVGALVRFFNDQVWHVASVAAAAILVSL